jgi:putative ABC transport system ATP-binding protein
MNLLTSFNREMDITIIMVTHEHDIAEYAGRAIHFRDGLVEQEEAA